MKGHLIASTEPIGGGPQKALCKREIVKPHLFMAFEGDLRTMTSADWCSLSNCTRCILEWRREPDKAKYRYLSGVSEAQEAMEAE